MPLNPFEIPSCDLDDLSRLTESESYSIEGQVQKMGMVEEMVRKRYDAHLSEVERELRAEGLEDHDFDIAFQSRVQKIQLRRLELGDGRFNLIVAKGDGDDDTPDPSLYRVMIPAHVDTVEPGAATELTLDIRHPERLQGLGVYDMAQGVVNNIALAAEAQVPPGMRAYFVFTVDEETHSRGARELIRQWEIWPHIDCVLSSEIGPVQPLPENDPRMRLITARSGRVKFIANIDVDPRSQGHGAIGDLPNAGDALRELQNRLHTRFYDGFHGDGQSEFEPAQARKHTLLGSEKIETGSYSATMSRSGYIPTDKARLEFAVKMVPPSTQREYTQLFQRWAKGIAKREEWAAFGINQTISFNTAQASYSPYEMPINHTLVSIASEIIKRVSGVLPEIVGAESVSDECDFAADMLKRQAKETVEGRAENSEWHEEKGILTIPPRGDKAHHPHEWVSKNDLMRVREAFRLLIEDDAGLVSMHRKRVEKSKEKT